MKNIVIGIFALMGLLIVAGGLRPTAYDSEFDTAGFAALPVLQGGRIKPMDSVARNHLLILRGKQYYEDAGGGKRPAIEWLMDLTMAPEIAHHHAVFRIDNDQVLALLGERQDGGKYFSFNELRPNLQEIEKQAASAPKEAQLRTVYERAVLKLYNNVMLYTRLMHTLRSPGMGTTAAEEYATFQAAIPGGIDAFHSMRASEDFDQKQLDVFISFLQNYQHTADYSPVRAVPGEAAEDWQTVAASLFNAVRTGSIDEAVLTYGTLVDAYARGDATAFNATVAKLDALAAERHDMGAEHVGLESFFNQFEPFTKSMVIYVLVFILAAVSWLKWPLVLSRAGFWLMVIACATHTWGLVARMVIQDRPPVTNLYSSAVFVGWACVLLCLLWERIYKNGLGNAAGAMTGFATLVIAQHLGTSGDTMEMMRAVLDSNFWLATHVVAISLGYSATFIAGFLALIFIARGMLTRGLDEDTAKSITGMVYGTLCFALFFSFTGTVLGGIWADQSWGRFWGWDPKENGALMIVIWNALVLHARWGRLVTRRGLMNLAVAGNIITAWSWFGTNMLGIGLHSYGFTDKAFVALMAFVLSQLAVIVAAALPARFWASKAAVGRIT